MVYRLLAAIAATLVATASQAQVFKCVDAFGRTTYQQAPCAKEERSVRVEISTDNGATSDSAALESQWAAAAKQGQVQAGMPKRFVQNVYGVPAEVRAGTSAERVTEVWTYRHPGGTRRLGFLDGRVSWERGDDASSAPPAADEAGDTAARREGPMVARRTIAPGADCASVIAEAGPPDRVEAVQVSTVTSGGRPMLAPAVRNVYDDDGGSQPRGLAFTCFNGIVRDIERVIR
jgi:hypothetical protein